MGVLTDLCMIFTLAASLKDFPFTQWSFFKIANRVASRYAVLIILVVIWNLFWFVPQSYTSFEGKVAFAGCISLLLAILPIVEIHKLPKLLRRSETSVFLAKFEWMQYDWKYIMVRLVLLDCIVQYSWILILRY